MHIIFLLDKSSSMKFQIDQTINGFNNFITNQKLLETKEDCRITLYEFSNNLELIYENININDIEKLDKNIYRTFGSTALYDSMGKILEKININTIFDYSQKQFATEKTLLVVITDGQDNISHQYNSSNIKNIVESKKDYLELIYLGSNHDSIDVGNKINSSLSINYTDDNLEVLYGSLSNSVSRVRKGVTKRIVFTNEEKRNVFTKSYDDNRTIKKTVKTNKKVESKIKNKKILPKAIPNPNPYKKFSGMIQPDNDYEDDDFSCSEKKGFFSILSGGIKKLCKKIFFN